MAVGRRYVADRCGRPLEDIADGGDALDRARRFARRFELAPQVTDVGSERVRVAALTSPDVCMHAAGWHDVPLIRREQIENAEFGRREPDRCFAPDDLGGLRVESETLQLYARLSILF